MKVLFTLVPIAILFLLGVFIALRSGIEGVRDWRNARHMIASNASELILKMFGLIAGLVVVQRMIGNPIVLNW